MEDFNQKVPLTKTTFVFVVMAFCLIVSTYMGFDTQLTGKVSEIVADGLISLASFLAVSYLASSSVDYSGVLHKIGGRLGGRVVAPVAPDVPPSPGYVAVNPQYVDPNSPDAKG